MTYIKVASFEEHQRISAAAVDRRHEQFHKDAGTECRMPTADGEPIPPAEWAAIGANARRYVASSYNHADGSGWVGIVSSVEDGETEISEAEYAAATAANFEANVAYEKQRIADERKALDAEPTISAAERRKRIQDEADAADDGEEYTPEPGVTFRERQEQAAALTYRLLAVNEWVHPKDAPIDHDAVMAARETEKAQAFIAAIAVARDVPLFAVPTDALPQELIVMVGEPGFVTEGSKIEYSPEEGVRSPQ